MYQSSIAYYYDEWCRRCYVTLDGGITGGFWCFCHNYKWWYVPSPLHHTHHQTVLSTWIYKLMMMMITIIKESLSSVMIIRTIMWIINEWNDYHPLLLLLLVVLFRITPSSRQQFKIDINGHEYWYKNSIHKNVIIIINNNISNTIPRNWKGQQRLNHESSTFSSFYNNNNNNKAIHSWIDNNCIIIGSKSTTSNINNYSYK